MGLEFAELFMDYADMGKIFFEEIFAGVCGIWMRVGVPGVGLSAGEMRRKMQNGSKIGRMMPIWGDRN